VTGIRAFQNSMQEILALPCLFASRPRAVSAATGANASSQGPRRSHVCGGRTSRAPSAAAHLGCGTAWSTGTVEQHRIQGWVHLGKVCCSRLVGAVLNLSTPAMGMRPTPTAARRRQAAVINGRRTRSRSQTAPGTKTCPRSVGRQTQHMHDPPAHRRPTPSSSA
jgi:hypothetical protein